MGFLLYSLLLLVVVPLNIVALRKVNSGRPLGWFTNNIMVSQLNMTGKLKAGYWIIFYGFHLFMLVRAIDIGAFLSCFLFSAYMVITPMLQSALKKKNWAITSVPVAHPADTSPIVSAPPTGYTAQNTNMGAPSTPAQSQNMSSQPPPLM